MSYKFNVISDNIIRDIMDNAKTKVKKTNIKEDIKNDFIDKNNKIKNRKVSK